MTTQLQLINIIIKTRVYSFPPFLGAFAKLRKVTISFVTFVRPYGTTRLPLDGFS